MIRALLFLFALALSLSRLGASEEPYALWQHGRPAEAVPALRDIAEHSDQWQAWYDLGLAAAAANQPGPAAAWVLKAHMRAPWRAEPRHALTVLGSPPPAGWLTWLGPVAWPGTGWSAVVIAALAGLSFAAACIARNKRSGWLVGALVATLIVAPGLVASFHDTRQPLAVILQSTQLLDASGHPLRSLPAGLITTLLDHEAWQERRLVMLADGTRGYVSVVDVAVASDRTFPIAALATPRDAAPTTLNPTSPAKGAP